MVAIGVLLTFFVSALPSIDFSRYALNIGADPVTGAAIELPEGGGPFLPFGFYGVLAAMPFAVWLFLAIEQLPLAAKQMIGAHRQFVSASESCQRLPELALLAGSILTYLAATLAAIMQLVYYLILSRRN